jgi:oligoendopeptidase F
MTAPRDRKDVPVSDQWDLTLIYATSQHWEADFEALKAVLPRIEPLQGTLGASPKALKVVLNLNMEIERLGEKLGEYAHLKTAEDVADSESGERMGRFLSVATQLGAAFAFLTPEIQAIDDATWAQWIADPLFADDRIGLHKIRRYKPHVLGAEAEKVLALGAESRGGVQKAFSSLTNADMSFGTIVVDGQAQSLTQSSFSVFLQSPDRKVRRQAFDQFYAQFQGHENTLASMYAASIQQDVYLARARGFASARDRALFADDVPASVYDNLIQSVHDAFPVLHRYYDLRRRLLGLEQLHHSDVYAPMVAVAEVHHTWDQAVDAVIDAVKPLGENYQQVLAVGLRGGWADRYENKGKRSGAFSAGGFDTQPFILMNFKEASLRDVFTLAHEAGHSMHSWHSVRHNPFQHYGYTIFEAEVASTFNEQLLAKILLERSIDKRARAAILGKLIEDTVATLFRQTMFAEFEHLAHAKAEAGEGLTLEVFRSIYRGLLEQYFGPDVVLEPNSALECLRIPHFYGAFYVYKYATGLSASLALSDRVLNGGAAERDQYLDFLKSGGSRFPLESLKVAGVNMAGPEPVRRALKVFERSLGELEALLA